MNSSSVCLPNVTEEHEGTDAITNMWPHHYKELFNCIGVNNFARNNV